MSERERERERERRGSAYEDHVDNVAVGVPILQHRDGADCHVPEVPKVFDDDSVEDRLGRATDELRGHIGRNQLVGALLRVDHAHRHRDQCQRKPEQHLYGYPEPVPVQQYPRG